MARIYTYSFLLSVCLLLLFPFTTEAQQKAYPFVQNFEPEQYGAHSQTWNITQTREGHILVGTGTGIVMYDGQEFSFPIGTPLMVSNLITTSDGEIFYGADNKLGQLVDGPNGFPHYSNLDTEMNSELQNFGSLWNLIEHDNQLIIPTRDRIILYSGEYEIIEAQENSFYKAHSLNDQIYIGESNTGLLMLNAENELELAPGGELFSNDNMPFFMLPFDEYRAVIGTVKDGLFWYYTNQLDDTPEGSLKPFPNEVNDLLKSASIRNGIKLQNGNFAIGTSTAGVFIINQKGELVQKIDKRAGLQSDIVNHLYEDRQGNLWMALNQGFSMAEIASPISHL